MNRMTMGFFAAILVVSSASGLARAQDAQAAPQASAAPTPQAAPIISVAPSANAPAQDKYLAYNIYRRDELKRSVPRTRNALIGTSVSFAVGLALLIPVWTGDHCTWISNSYYEYSDHECDTTGKVLSGIGGTLAWGGSLGMIVSGIMLGVRKGKIRRLDKQIMLTSERKLRWDTSTSRLVF